MILKSIFSSFLVLTLLSNLTFAQGTSTRKTHDVVETLPEIVITISAQNIERQGLKGLNFILYSNGNK
ncbi:MAG: hypothetical protein HY578_05390 [Nitrospinae bacterium]|nr:hypothetical protein [Nitrospinota bacterium]